MSRIYYQNIRTFLTYNDVRVGIFYFGSPCILYKKTTSNHRAMFHGDQSRELGDVALKKRRTRHQ